MLGFVHSLTPRPRGIVLGAFARARASSGKPFVIVAPGGLAADEQLEYEAADLRVVADSDAALQAVAAVLMPRPADPDVIIGADFDVACLNRALPLSEPEALALLAACGLPVVRTELVATEAEAVEAADAIGWPVVLKGVVPGVAHKTEARLVRIGLRDEHALRAAGREMGVGRMAVQQMVSGRAEAFIGVTRVDGLGQMLVAGLGGIFAEALRERVLWPLPASRADIIGKLTESALGRLLTSERWPWPDALSQLTELLLRLQSIAITAGDRLEAIDVNPVILTAEGPVAVDALIVPAAYRDGRTSAANVSSSARAL